MARNDKYSVVVLDIDGTMVGPDRIIPERLKVAAGAAEQAGAVVVIATGRTLRSSLQFAEQLGTTSPVICYQGALTVDDDHETVLRHVRLHEDVANLAIQTFDKLGAHVNVYVDDKVHIRRSSTWSDGYAERMDLEPTIVYSLAPVAAQRPTLVLGVMEPDAAKLVAAARSVVGARAEVTHSLPHFCEVGHKDAGKEKALQHLAEMWDIPSARFVTFGDGAGDAGMLRWAGMGVAMESGHPDAIRSADRCAAGPPGIAVARVLEEMLEYGRLGRA